LFLPASVETTLIVPATLIMKVAMVSSHFPMKRTMPPSVAVTESIMEAIVSALEAIMYFIVSAFESIMVVTPPSAMLRVEAECGHGQQ